MAEFANKAVEAQRDSAIRHAIKANVSWTQLSEDYGLSLEEIIRITDRLGLSGAPKRADDLKDAREEGRRG